VDFIEPDFELLDHLLRLDVLNYRQVPDSRSERTVFRRNDALLELLTSEDQCVRFLYALQGTDQQHVVNYIRQNGGQRRNHFITYLSNVAQAQRQIVKSHLISIHFIHLSVCMVV